MIGIRGKKGLIKEIEIIVVLFIALLLIIFIYFLFATSGPVIIGESQSIIGTIQQSFGATTQNDTLANATKVATNTASGFLGIVEGAVYLFFIGALIGYVGVCYYVKSYKWLAMIWIVLMVGATVISMVVSNAYQDAANSSSDIAALYQTWGTNDFLMNNLPYLVGAFGVVSGIILFAIIGIGSEEETINVN